MEVRWPEWTWHRPGARRKVGCRWRVATRAVSPLAPGLRSMPHPSSSAASRRPSFEQVAHPIAIRQQGVVARFQLLDAGVPLM